MKQVVTAILVILSCVACFGQSGFQEITPGVSARSEVNKVLGKPVRSITGTSFEYSPPTGIAKVEVEYRAGTELVERVEIYFAQPVSRQALIKQFSLPQAADKKVSAGGALVEYFGATALLALTYSAADASSGISHIGYYSRELFSTVTGIRSEASQPSSPAGGNRASCFYDPEMASTNRTDHFNWAQRQTVAYLEATLTIKFALLFECPSMNGDQLSSAFADVSVVIARAVRDWSCFAGDPGALSEDWSAHKQWASSRSAKDIARNLRFKISTALKCLDRSGKSSLFAGVSVALAKAAL